MLVFYQPCHNAAEVVVNADGTKAQSVSKRKIFYIYKGGYDFLPFFAKL